MRLRLIRHGQTASNVAGLLDTAFPGPQLTPLGRRQASAIPTTLGASVSAVFASPHQRAQQTAAPLAEAVGVPVVTVDGLREVDAGDLEMADSREAVAQYLGTIFAWARGDHGRRMPGGSDGHAFLNRFDRAVEAIAATGVADAVAVAHGAAIRGWASARVHGLDVDEIEHSSFANTAFVVVDGDPEHGWDLVEWSPLPIGGAHLRDEASEDPTGEAVDEVQSAVE